MSASSNGVKNGFFGYIKGLFRKEDTTPTTAEYYNSDTTEVALPPLTPRLLKLHMHLKHP